MLQVNKDAILFSQEFKAEDTIKNPDLAKTLRRLAKNDKNEFYFGETADILADFMKKKEKSSTKKTLLLMKLYGEIQ